MTRELLGTNPEPTRAEPLPGELPSTVKKAFAELDSSRMELEAFRKKNPKVIEQYETLKTALSKALEEAKHEFAKNHEVLGDSFQGFSMGKRRGIDAAELLARIPELKPYVSLSMDVKTFDALVEQGLIPGNVAHKFEYATQVINSPKK